MEPTAQKTRRGSCPGRWASPNMKRKWTLVLGFICLGVVVGYFYGSALIDRIFFGPGGGRGQVMDHWETANKTFNVRITEYEEKNPIFLYRFNYVVETSPGAASEWRELIDTWTDDDIPIPHGSVNFLSDRVGYVAMGESFAATIDGGRTWSVWDAKKRIPNWECCNQAFIKDIHLASDGKGQMILSPRFNQIPTTALYTNDFGINWNSQ
jgi:hypothetical protein